MQKTIKSAFISVFHKTNGLDLIIQKLHELGVSISSTGGTADFIEGLGVPVIKAETITGYPSILGGRVKTLHPKIMGGILARRENQDDLAQLQQYEIPEMDLVIVDLYPFEKTVDSGASHEEIVEKIDIGGISLIRAAAKNYNDVTIVASMDQYPVLLDILQTQGTEITEQQRYEFATKAFVTAAVYDLSIAMYFGRGDYYGIIGEKVRDLRYGENPNQKARFYKIIGQDDPFGLDKIQWLEGNSGFINLTDFDGSLQTLTHIAAAYYKNNLWRDMGFTSHEQFPYLAIGVKHGNACGAAISATSPKDCLMKMIDGNLISIFGASVVTNFTITRELADILIRYHSSETRRILDVIVAPAIDEDALEILKRKSDKCKIGVLPVLAKLDADSLDDSILIRKIRGGFIAQQNYDSVLDLEAEYISKYGPSTLLFGLDKMNIVLAWAICSTSNSNTIVLVKDQMLIGAGVGQKDRLECCNLAIEIAQKAGHIPFGSVACSDSFFPFPDGPEKLITAGVKIIFTTSGSVGDKKTISLCEDTKTSLLMIPNELGRMFYRH